MATAPEGSLEQAQARFDLVAGEVGLHPPGTLRSAGATLNDLRRGRRRAGIAKTGSIALAERNGMLFWELGPAAHAAGPRRRPVRRRLGLLGRVLGRKDFIALEPNEIGKYLEDLDRQLTPDRGLRQWDPVSNTLIPLAQVATDGPILLVIHGTFSRSEHLFDDIRKAPNGAAFLANAAARYKQILGFDHATVSVSPMLNALDLRNSLAGSSAAVDIVCHSRGGLVARWWMEVLDTLPTRPKRAVFVASPLSGTSLAAPDKLRAGLNVMANLSRLLGNAAMALPLMKAPAAILRIIGSIVGVASRTPLVDAALAMIPGLNAQSRISNNSELTRLNRSPLSQPRYFFVRSDFENSAVGWELCRYIREAKIRTADAAADLLVFPGQNDLVVDTASMTEAPGIVPGGANMLDFGTNAEVHHTNYFLMQRTIDFIAKSLAVG